MRALSSDLRKQLETSVLAARRAAEGASSAALAGLGVFADKRPEHLDADQAVLRSGLRAKWRQLDQKRELLISECAYEQWHRLLFARFLAENDLLLHPEFKAPVTLADCDELAGELGEPDGWSVAARFAAQILPGIFRLDDPCVRLRLAPEGRHALEQILDGLPAEVFAAADALGWVYQFWQKDKKDEVNASERKIGGADLGPVTQLFTENYMVRFLLENSLGAWWAARHPGSPLLKGFDYLRFDDDGRPASGSFDRWPQCAADVTVMDPCCGSGHFLVEVFSMLWKMRAEEEGLTPVEAQDAVLYDNLFGLELDPRCVQIAMFAIALQAWRAGGGWRQLPVPNISCSGIPVKAPVEEWKALANGDPRLENALVRLHILFRDADTLGSLIDPKRATEVSDPTAQQTSFEDVDWDEISPLLEGAAARTADAASRVLGADAGAIAEAAALLSRSFSLVVTNVPYLQRGAHSELMRSFADERFRSGRADLATMFTLRALAMADDGATVALVTPQNWLYLKTFEKLRRLLLATIQWELLAVLGLDAFESISSGFVDVFLGIWTHASPLKEHSMHSVDVSSESSIAEKRAALVSKKVRSAPQADQPGNPMARIQTRGDVADSYLSVYAKSFVGIQTGDTPRYVRCFWELNKLGGGWEPLLTAPASKTAYTGRDQCLFWEGGRGSLASSPGARVQGLEAWGRRGVAMAQMGALNATLYDGEIYDQAAPVVIPNDPDDLGAVWSFMSSADFAPALRDHYAKSVVAPAAFVHVPFEIDRWRKVAEEAGPLPQPWSEDPSQWLFEGRPERSTSPLQVAVARLVGYRWPEQAEADDLDSFIDSDGIVCLPSVAGEAPAADRLHQLLAAAFGEAWSPARAKELLQQAGSKKNLADWLRDEFFKQHCAVFGNRPFVWHIWDGQRDGFSALVNCHRLDRKTLEKLTYTYLGQDWVERQRAAAREEVPGAEARLAAALALQRKLEAILEGEKPYDIYVRWKERHEQPIGWEPDLNDGVRLNIRPYVHADVLRAKVNVRWTKDRGANPDGSERLNDVHLSLAEKREARARVGRA